MLIRDLYKKDKTVLSLEVFPPNKDSSIESIIATLEDITSTRPEFLSVTYGASGKMEKTKYSQVIANTAKHIYDIEPLFHLTCVENTNEQIDKILKQLNQSGIKNILALRGDTPDGVTATKKELIMQ